MILVDTGVLYGGTDSADALYSVADELAVTTPVAVETAWLLEDRIGPGAEADFLASIRRRELTRVDLTDADWERVEDLIRQYEDLGLGTADASIVAVAERLGITTIATFNERDFRVVRPRHVEAFELVPRS